MTLQPCRNGTAAPFHTHRFNIFRGPGTHLSENGRSSPSSDLAVVAGDPLLVELWAVPDRRWQPGNRGPAGPRLREEKRRDVAAGGQRDPRRHPQRSGWLTDRARGNKALRKVKFLKNVRLIISSVTDVEYQEILRMAGIVPTPGIPLP